MDIRVKVHRLVPVAAVLLIAVGFGSDLVPAQPVALLTAIEGPIGPGMTRHVENVIEAARERNAEVLILGLDTPGGLAAGTHLGAATPVQIGGIPGMPERRDREPSANPAILL